MSEPSDLKTLTPDSVVTTQNTIKPFQAPGFLVAQPVNAAAQTFQAPQFLPQALTKSIPETQQTLPAFTFPSNNQQSAGNPLVQINLQTPAQTQTPVQLMMPVQSTTPTQPQVPFKAPGFSATNQPPAQNILANSDSQNTPPVQINFAGFSAPMFPPTQIKISDSSTTQIQPPVQIQLPGIELPTQTQIPAKGSNEKSAGTPQIPPFGSINKSADSVSSVPNVQIKFQLLNQQQQPAEQTKPTSTKPPISINFGAQQNFVQLNSSSNLLSQNALVFSQPSQNQQIIQTTPVQQTQVPLLNQTAQLLAENPKVIKTQGTSEIAQSQIMRDSSMTQATEKTFQSLGDTFSPSMLKEFQVKLAKSQAESGQNPDLNQQNFLQAIQTIFQTSQSSKIDHSIMSPESSVPLKKTQSDQPVLQNNGSQIRDSTSSDVSTNLQRQQSSGKSSQIFNLDVAFLHSDAMVTKDKNQNVSALKWEQTLNPEEMFERINKSLYECLGNKARIFQSHLNFNTLQTALTQKPKILVLNCHGEKRYTGKNQGTHFWFEDVDCPSIVDDFDEQRLKKMFCSEVGQQALTNVKLVIISACHSGDLAKIFHAAKIPSVVGITASTQVMEEAAQSFNSVFLQYLIQGYPVKQAFELAVKSLQLKKGKHFQSCCCDHNHKIGCLWYDQWIKADKKKEAHSLHDAQDCKCQSDDGIDHVSKCKSYQKFYNTILKGNSEDDEENNQDLINQLRVRWQKEQKPDSKEQKRDWVFFGPPITTSLQSGPRYNRMCCCSPELPHDESQKFIFLGDEEQIIFDQDSMQTDLTSSGRSKPYSNYEMKKIDWKVKENNKHWLFERNLEIHEIVEFFFDKNLKLLAVTGPENMGKDEIITKAVLFSLQKRHEKILSDQVYKVELSGIERFSQVIVKIAQALQLSPQPTTEKDLIQEISKSGKHSFIYFTRCSCLDQKDTQILLLELCDQIIQESGKIKIILELGELYSTKVSENPKQFKQLRINELSSELRLKFFKSQVMNANNQHLINFETVMKDHPVAFQNIRTDMLERIAFAIKEKEDFEKEYQKYILQAEQLNSIKKLREIAIDVKPSLDRRVTLMKNKSMVETNQVVIDVDNTLKEKRITFQRQKRPLQTLDEVEEEKQTDTTEIELQQDNIQAQDENLTKDFLTALVEYMSDHKIPVKERIQQAINTVQKRIDNPIQIHLGFDVWKEEDKIQAWKDEDNGKNYLGEVGDNNVAQGRGVNIDSQDSIWFGRFENGNLSIGNYLCIINDAKFRVGERYLNEEGRTKVRGTQYNVDGTSSLFGYNELQKNASEESKGAAKEYMTAMIEYMTSKQIPELDQIKRVIDTVEKTTGMSVQHYLGFGNKESFQEIQSHILDDSKCQYYGELSSNKQATGRGILFNINQCIQIGYLFRNQESSGNQVRFHQNGLIELIERYQDNKNKLIERGTRYQPNGKREKYGQPKDFITAVIDQLTYHQIQEVHAFKAAIDTIEKRLGKPVGQFLEFKNLENNQNIIVESSAMIKYCGEVNEKGQQHGRGVILNRKGNFTFELSENGSPTLGKYLTFNVDGSFQVGEKSRTKLFKKWKHKGVIYNIDGTTQKFDHSDN